MELPVIDISSAVGGSRLRAAALTLGVVPMLVLAACSSSPTGPSNNSTSFDGVIASPTLTGALSFSVASTTLDVVRVQGTAAAPTVTRPVFAAASTEVTVTGTLKLDGGATVQLTGTYDTSSHALSLSGGGYTFTGTFANGRIDGTFTSPTDSGSFSAESSASATIRNYCGTFSGNTDQGHFNITVNLTDGTLWGAWASGTDGKSGGLSGTNSGSNVTINVLENGASVGTVVTGTITATSISGTYGGSGGDSGTVTGGVCS
ncbi:MAG TPA: hypothetical protein VFW66_03790 [Gemmatimonadales bacterium]|nr:hypothetical protein [Gemmatimonadales bacterium]